MLSRHHQIALVDGSTDRVLVVPSDGGVRLPQHPRRWPDLADLVAAVGAPGARLAGPPWREDDGTVVNVLLGDGTTSLAGEWRALDDLADVGIPAVSAAGVARTLHEHRCGGPDDGRPAWFRRSWRDDVLAWVDGLGRSLGFERVGEPEEAKMWSLSAVLRLPVVRDGAPQDLWFKATCEGFHAEPGLTGAVRRLAPDVTPPVLAVDGDRAWMLMEPIPGAATGAPPERAPEVARRLAALQLDTLPARAELAAVGVPDRGLDATLAMLHTVTAESIERRLMTEEQVARARELEPWLAERLHLVWSFGLPDTLSHGDLHLGNVAWVDDRPLLFDWTDACFTHPFFDARHLADSAAEEAGPEGAEAAREAVWAAYSAPWREAYLDVDVDAAWAAVRLAEATFQAISYEQIYRAQPEVSRWELAGVVVGILDRLVEVRDEEAGVTA